jgi:hypothetical protein
MLSSTTIDGLTIRSRSRLLYTVFGNSGGQRGAHLAQNHHQPTRENRRDRLDRGSRSFHLIQSFGPFSTRRSGNFPLIRLVNLQSPNVVIGSRSHVNIRSITVAHDWGQVLNIRVKTGSLFGAFTTMRAECGNWAECSTELAPIIEFLAQGSIKPEPRWLVPLRQPKMPENEWKPMLRLFH